MIFEWDDTKEAVNIKKHGVNFKTAEKAFFDTKRITTLDNAHSTDKETRYYSHLRVKIPNSCHCERSEAIQYFQHVLASGLPRMLRILAMTSG